MKARVIFEDETGSRKIILNIEQIGDELEIKKFTFPAKEFQEQAPLVERLATTLIEQLIK